MTEDEEASVCGPISSCGDVSCVPSDNDTRFDFLWAWVDDGIEANDDWVGNAVQEAEAV
jgi:hypothetical protein